MSHQPILIGGVILVLIAIFFVALGLVVSEAHLPEDFHGDFEEPYTQSATGQLRVSLSTEAEIIVDGWQVQTGKVLLFDQLSTGSHKVIVRKTGHFPEERRIAIEEGRTFDLSIDLTKKSW